MDQSCWIKPRSDTTDLKRHYVIVRKQEPGIENEQSPRQQQWISVWWECLTALSAEHGGLGPIERVQGAFPITATWYHLVFKKWNNQTIWLPGQESMGKMSPALFSFNYVTQEYLSRQPSKQMWFELIISFPAKINFWITFSKMCQDIRNLFLS